MEKDKNIKDNEPVKKGDFKDRKNEIEDRENEIEEGENEIEDRENEIKDRENEIEERKNEIKGNKSDNFILSLLLFCAGFGITSLTITFLAPYVAVAGIFAAAICGGVALSSIGCGLFNHFIIKKNKDELSNIKQSLKDDKQFLEEYKETLKDNKETLKNDKETLKDDLLTAQNKEIDSLKQKVKVMQAVNVSAINTLAENEEELTI